MPLKRIQLFNIFEKHEKLLVQTISQEAIFQNTWTILKLVEIKQKYILSCTTQKQEFQAMQWNGFIR